MNSKILFTFSSLSFPFIREDIVIAPALIIGLRGFLNVYVSNLSIELNGSPVGSFPTNSNIFSSP